MGEDNGPGQGLQNLFYSLIRQGSPLIVLLIFIPNTGTVLSFGAALILPVMKKKAGANAL